MRADELYDKYKAEEDKSLEVKDAGKAGDLMILSTMNLAPKEIYRVYKIRCAIENFFDTAKNDLGGDTIHLSTIFT